MFRTKGVKLLNNLERMSKVFAISDLHVDIKQNRDWVSSVLCSGRYNNDALIIAGDITDNIDLLRATLSELVSAFACVSYVPGNHELWIRSTKSRPNTLENSIQKFHEIIELCNTVGVHTKPVKVHCHGSTGGDVWLVPLFSWYTQPEENKTDSLYVEGRNENREISKSLWMDNHLCKWPETQVTISKYFENLNKELLAMEYDSPVISFSHFLPRQELIIPTEDEIKSIEKERQAMGLEQLNNPRLQGATAGFNFSRYAGCKSLERQIRKLGSNIHIHGHQHRNRDRAIDGVQYISFCLGYPRERSQGLMWGFSRFNGPKQVWPCL